MSEGAFNVPKLPAPLLRVGELAILENRSRKVLKPQFKAGASCLGFATFNALAFQNIPIDVIDGEELFKNAGAVDGIDDKLNKKIGTMCRPMANMASAISGCVWTWLDPVSIPEAIAAGIPVVSTLAWNYNHVAFLGFRKPGCALRWDDDPMTTGNHAVTVIGYNPAQKTRFWTKSQSRAFLVLNPWRPDDPYWITVPDFTFDHIQSFAIFRK